MVSIKKLKLPDRNESRLEQLKSARFHFIHFSCNSCTNESLRILLQVTITKISSCPNEPQSLRIVGSAQTRNRNTRGFISSNIGDFVDFSHVFFRPLTRRFLTIIKRKKNCHTSNTFNFLTFSSALGQPIEKWQDV